MSLNSTPSAERVHISFFGRRNAGKSSVVNAVTNQNLSIVSDIKGTTTDPVNKAMELLPLGPVIITDTAGIDDEGELGQARIEKTKNILNKTDIAVLVVDASEGLSNYDNNLINLFKEKNTPYIVAYNKIDLLENAPLPKENECIVSALTGKGINDLKEKMAHIALSNKKEKHIVSHLLNENDIVVLVVPIDSSAPKGRLILPQQQVIRDIIDCGASAIVVKETGLKALLEKLSFSVKMVITDSQVFSYVEKIVPPSIPLTSFSILMANYKGNLEDAVKGVSSLKNIENGDKILISEGCTHHRQCEDIGTVKIPNILRKFTGKEIDFNWSSGNEFTNDITKYKAVIHCGGCMLNEREMQHRFNLAKNKNVPITNYGITIAYATGILKRSIEIFPEISKLL